MKGKTNSQTGGARGENLNITLTSNQADKSDLIGATVTVSYGDETVEQVWDGSVIVVKVPQYVDYTVAVSAIEGYSQPSSYSGTASNQNNSLPLTFTYNTEVVSVTLSADDGSSVNGAKVTINGKSHTWNGSVITQKVPYGTVYSVVPKDLDGFSTPSAQTNITANQPSRSFAFSYVASALKVNILSNQDNDSTIASVKATISVKMPNGGTGTFYASNGDSFSMFPAGSTGTLTFSEVEGYKTPEPIDFTFNGGFLELTGTYKCSVVTVVLDDNQTEYNDISSATASVTGSSTATVSSGGIVKVPWGGTITITGSAVSGYNTPSASYTATDVSKSITLTYTTHILTVNVVGSGATPSGYTITVKNSTAGTTIGTQTTSTKVYKIPYGIKYTVIASALSGYNSVTSQNGNSNSQSNTITVTYVYNPDPGLTTPTDGVWILSTDKKYYTTENWSRVSKVADCIYIKSGSKKLGVALKGHGVFLPWYNDDSAYTNMDIYSDYTQALDVLNGKQETDELISYFGESIEFLQGHCASYATETYRSCYLPSLGEAYLISLNEDAIRDALSACGGTQIMWSGIIATSTRASNDSNGYRRYWITGYTDYFDPRRLSGGGYTVVCCVV